MRKTTSQSVPFGATVALVLALLGSSCLPKPPAESGDITITLYGFSVMKESMEKAVFPGFAAKWKQEHGQQVGFQSSFAGSETVTNQILRGAPADVAILSIERDVQRLQKDGFVTADWHLLPAHGIVNKTPFVIIVRQGNPKGITDFPDLAKTGIRLIHPDPISSGGAQWSILAIYGSELKKTKKEFGEADAARALQTLRAIWKNVIATERPVIDAFMQYLWSDEAQQAFVKFHFYSSTNDAFNQANTAFGHIEIPFAIDYFGGWDKAYPEVIEGIFRDQVQRK